MQRAATVARRSMATVAPSTSNLSIIKSWGPVGTWLRDQPNTVPQDQKMFGEAAGPTFYKKSSDKFVMMFVFGTMGLGLLTWGKGFTDIVLGRGKKAE